ncbi:MAG: ABC transporter ATP-binding protein [Alphaproteobacteria bacterium]|nr:ABC transporter ATP-binding protein [Alphaproteobacteria bacterium]
MLAVENLSVSLPMEGGRVPVLADVSFALARGESVGLVGESGSGKSMTALAIMGLLPPGAATSGRVLFDGRDLLAAAEPELCAIRGRRIGMVFQEPMTALNPLMSIGAQVTEPLRLHLRLGRAEAEARARRLLARVGLAQIDPHRHPHQLSGGQRQRVVIAIALACGPELLIADEPTTALDVTMQAQVLDLLGELAAEQGLALLLITHDLGVVSATAARVMVMYAGRVVEAGGTGAVFAAMAHPYTRALFAASPHEAGGRPAPIPGQVPDPQHRPPGCAFAPRCPRAQRDCVATVPVLSPLPFKGRGLGEGSACGASAASPAPSPPPSPASGRGSHVAACFHPHPAP